MDWIDINERQPEDGQGVLGYDPDLFLPRLFKAPFDWQSFGVTHWMPVPPPPRKVRWMPKVGESFYYIGRDGIPIEITSHVDDFMILHYRAFAGLYRTFAEAEKMAAKIRIFVTDEIGEVE